jgi:hypothetical protein
MIMEGSGSVPPTNGSGSRTLVLVVFMAQMQALLKCRASVGFKLGLQIGICTERDPYSFELLDPDPGPGDKAAFLIFKTNLTHL